jgi:hypothetical protein
MVKGRRIGYVLMVTVFLLGVLVGGGGALAWSQESHAATVREGKTLQRYKLRALKRRLELDREQEARVAGILEDDTEVSRALGRDVVQRCGQRLRDHQSRVDEDIRAVLHPDQQRRFDRLVDERHGKMWVPALGP